ncbi:hypothetical protein BDV96DRAFT_601256 [Lophiotrema nucula]|uniref:Uncharacterized protein n=1 Tax=Lophiotrema nucula TaxID=690887 RepID=A0A6A5Z2X4_9PLEO|nr:hypothetical protein BDV96DRAFT_601256 [Lophiotrema nucula]
MNDAHETPACPILSDSKSMTKLPVQHSQHPWMSENASTKTAIEAENDDKILIYHQKRRNSNNEKRRLPFESCYDSGRSDLLDVTRVFENNASMSFWYASIAASREIPSTSEAVRGREVRSGSVLVQDVMVDARFGGRNWFGIAGGVAGAEGRKSPTTGTQRGLYNSENDTRT